MLGVLNHPKLIYDWFTTTLLRWSGDGLVIYDQWVLNFSGVQPWEGSGGEVLLDFYYLCYLIAFVGVLFFFTRYRKLGWLKIRPHVPYDALLLTMIGVLCGAKAAYIFIYNPDFYFGAPPYGPVDTSDQLRRIFLNWSGMASHGAAAGVLLMAFLWWLKARPKIPIAQIGDVGGIAAAFGAIWIRLANFMNAELYGRAAPDWLPWAMRFPVRSGKGHAVVFANGSLYESMTKPADPAQAEVWLKGLEAANPGGVIDHGGYVLFKNPDAYLQGYDIAMKGKDGFEIVQQNQPGHILYGQFDVVTTARHPSQLYQLVLEGLIVFIILLVMRKRVKRAGMIAAGFFALYPLARFIGEFFRQPDVQFQQESNHLGTVFFGLSMGQVLSLIMACVGISMFLYFRKRGRIIADQEMWPAEEKGAPKKEAKKKNAPVSVPFEKGMGGSTGAGEIAGLGDVRAALAEKEKEWDAKHEKLQSDVPEDSESEPDAAEEKSDDDSNREPLQPEPGD